MMFKLSGSLSHAHWDHLHADPASCCTVLHGVGMVEKHNYLPSTLPWSSPTSMWNNMRRLSAAAEHYFTASRWKLSAKKRQHSSQREHWPRPAAAPQVFHLGPVVHLVSAAQLWNHQLLSETTRSTPSTFGQQTAGLLIFGVDTSILVIAQGEGVVGAAGFIGIVDGLAPHGGIEVNSLFRRCFNAALARINVAPLLCAKAGLGTFHRTQRILLQIPSLAASTRLPRIADWDTLQVGFDAASLVLNSNALAARLHGILCLKLLAATSSIGIEERHVLVSCRRYVLRQSWRNLQITVAGIDIAPRLFAPSFALSRHLTLATAFRMLIIIPGCAAAAQLTWVGHIMFPHTNHRSAIHAGKADAWTILRTESLCSNGDVLRLLTFQSTASKVIWTQCSTTNATNGQFIMCSSIL